MISSVELKLKFIKMKQRNDLLNAVKYKLLKKYWLGQKEQELVNDCVDELLKAINYSQCSIQLNDKYGKDFEYFINNQVNVQKIYDAYWFKDRLFVNIDELYKEWLKITKPLIF